MLVTGSRAPGREPESTVKRVDFRVVLVEIPPDAGSGLLRFGRVDARLLVSGLLEEICEGRVLVLSVWGDVDGWGGVGGLARRAAGGSRRGGE